MDTGERQPCWVHVGWQDAEGNCTILTWWFSPESASALVADLTARIGPPQMEEALSTDDLQALQESRLRHMGITYLKDGPAG